jgi:hypothetical protein
VKGHEYKQLVARYLVSAYGPRGLSVYDEVSVGTSILGKQRRIDLLVLPTASGHLASPSPALAVECKYQDSAGTVDEKIPYALEDLAALRMPGAIVYAGDGFSDGVLHLLRSSPFAAYCLPDESLRPVPRARGTESIHAGTWQLDHVIARTFSLWDVILGDKRPLSLDASGKLVAH